MYSEANRYFRYLDLVREDIREELDLLGLHQQRLKICDFGCGNGITTFGLALEVSESICTGIDLFDSEPTPNTLAHYIEILENASHSTQPPKSSFPGGIYELIKRKRLPQFIQGNVVSNQNLLHSIDLAYCKKLLTNLLGMNYEDAFSGEERLLAGLRHIRQSIRSNGLACVIEYDPKSKLGQYIELSGLHVLTQTQFKRSEIRSRGRTNVVSKFSIYLCRKTV